MRVSGPAVFGGVFTDGGGVSFANVWLCGVTDTMSSCCIAVLIFVLILLLILVIAL